MYYRVLVASQRFHGKESLTYSFTGPLAPGQLVAVPLQQRISIGIIDSKVQKPTFSTKDILYSWPLELPEKSLSLLAWMYGYYPAPLGLITELFTPSSLPQKIADTPKFGPGSPAAKLPTLTSEQSKVLAAIVKAKTRSILLHGDTGTGKTRVYVELAKRALDQGKSALILTPEIGLTEPLLHTFTQTFGERVLITHSGMTPAQRRAVWLAAIRSQQALVIIGPRSAVFSPLKNIGLIVMDEAHDGAYKQEQAPYYQTSRVAAQLAHLHDALFVLGSATPLINDYFTFEQKGLPIIRMSKPAIGAAQAASVLLLDQRDKANFTKSPWLANDLLDAIGTAMRKGEQSLLFLNRRGSARLVMCERCLWQAMCPHCDVALTYHQDQHLMRCHSCDFSGKVPLNCPSCGASELIFKSIGTKALESELGRLFPRARISRFDRDTDKALRLQHQYQALHTGDVDILIGTQAIAKGFDLPKLSVVGIAQSDSGLQIPDYTATERTFQLLSQVSGRVGRGHRAGRLFVQTYDPDSALIALAMSKDYRSFYEQELRQREQYGFPPFTYLLKVTCSRASSRSATAACQKIIGSIQTMGLRVHIDGPSPRFIEKISGRHAWHIIIKSKDRTNLLKVIAKLPGNSTYDLDPSNLL
ncbi:MAG TPA: primosomal protein N' [Candidatus Saccharimonadales bacterium]|nr:primosomal protein N' [Candidatus Saccharimonadales bacterium]